jgi:uncharacterized damage-inducible protein DinB
VDADYFRMLFDYCYWARDRLLAAASGLTEGEYARPNGFSRGSLRGILTHVMSAEASWYVRLHEGSPPAGPIAEEDAPTLEALGGRWREEESRMRGLLEGLRDEEVRRELVIRRTSGEEVRYPLGYYLAHLINHGTQHRSEAAEALTMIGRSPGELDVFLYLREKDR